MRPTRDETRERIFAAAAGVFAEHGVAATTVEQIAAAAGFSRGAFYSNFDTKDELAVAMLDDHVTRSGVHNRALMRDHPDAAGLVQALRDDLDRQDPLHRNPLLQVELMLYVARRPDLRPLMGERLASLRRLVGEVAVSALAADGVEDADPDAVGTILVALEDGLRLHRLVDPDSTPSGAFLDALDILRRMVTPPR
ncbi:MAG TPA: TetR/AcrR family transcriptional regulator [Acidimicrobiales bacterium]